MHIFAPQLLKIFVIIIAVFLIFSITYRKLKKENNGSQNSSVNILETNSRLTDQEEQIDFSEWVIYMNNKLGVKFRYPSSWGNVETFSPKDLVHSGEYVELSFSKIADSGKHYIGIGFMTPDFEYGGRLGGEWSRFKGNENNLNCPSDLDCYPIPNLTVPSRSYFLPVKPRGDCCVYWFTKQAKILSPHPEYKGVSVFYHIPGLDKWTEDPQEYTLDVYGEEILHNIRNGLIEEKILKELNQFDAMVRTIKFLPSDLTVPTGG